MKQFKSEFHALKKTESLCVFFYTVLQLHYLSLANHKAQLTRRVLFLLMAVNKTFAPAAWCRRQLNIAETLPSATYDSLNDKKPARAQYMELQKKNENTNLRGELFHKSSRKLKNFLLNPRALFTIIFSHTRLVNIRQAEKFFALFWPKRDIDPDERLIGALLYCTTRVPSYTRLAYRAVSLMSGP